MLSVTVDAMQRDPSTYLRQVEAGETIVIVQADKAIAELRRIPSNSKQLRPFGWCAGEFTLPNDFDESLPEEPQNFLLILHIAKYFGIRFLEIQSR